MHQLKRILMSAVDSGGSGGGNPAPDPAAPATPPTNVPQAQGAAISMTQEQLTALVANAATKAVNDAKDSIFAEARRTFTAAKPTGKPASSSPAAPQEPVAMSATEERMLLRSFDRGVSQLGFTPTAQQYQRAERDLLADRPEQVDVWLKDYFAGYAAAAAPAQPAAVPNVTPAQPPAPPVGQPASNRGTPPAPNTSLELKQFRSWPEADRQAYLRDKGPAAYTKALHDSLKGQPIALRR